MSDLRLKLVGTFLFILAFAMISCDKDTTIEDVDNYVNESIFGLEKDANAGRFGCVEFVFPIDIVFPDGTTESVDSYEDLKETLMNWKEENQDVDERPSLGYPLDVINQDGEVVTVNDKSELIELKRECIGNFDRPRPHLHRWCFKLVYPVTIEFPDETTAEVGSRLELKQAVRQWKMDNPDVDGRPHLVFPVTIEYRDGTTVEVESPEQLKELKRACRG